MEVNTEKALRATVVLNTIAELRATLSELALQLRGIFLQIEFFYSAIQRDTINPQ